MSPRTALAAPTGTGYPAAPAAGLTLGQMLGFAPSAASLAAPVQPVPTLVSASPSAPAGAMVVPATGRVSSEFSGVRGGYGNLLIVDHGDGRETY